jgi:hypothetical protein
MLWARDGAGKDDAAKVPFLTWLQSRANVPTTLESQLQAFGTSLQPRMQSLDVLKSAVDLLANPSSDIGAILRDWPLGKEFIAVAEAIVKVKVSLPRVNL